MQKDKTQEKVSIKKVPAQKDSIKKDMMKKDSIKKDSMQKGPRKKGPVKKVSMLDIIPKNMDWNRYSRLHDSFLEELSYETRKFCHTDVWQLHYI